VLTTITQVFGIKGQGGDLLIEPRLSAEQFRDASSISISRTFAGKKLKINFSNPKKVAWPKYRIIKANLNGRNISPKDQSSIIIQRKAILKLLSNKINTLNIILG
jgi:cellobiose phosphorylase